MKEINCAPWKEGKGREAGTPSIPQYCDSRVVFDHHTTRDARAQDTGGLHHDWILKREYK